MTWLRCWRDRPTTEGRPAGWRFGWSALYPPRCSASALQPTSLEPRFVHLTTDITRDFRLTGGLGAAALYTVLLLTAACTATAGGSTIDADPQLALLPDGLDLEVPERGFQLTSVGALLEAGDDEEWCEVLQLPGGADDAYYVNRIDAQMSPTGRRLVVSAAIPGSETEANMTVGDRVPCVRAGEVFGEDLVEVIATQRGYENLDFPDHVGRIYFGGQKIAIDYRYAVTGSQPSLSRARINFHRTSEAEVGHIARTAAFNNVTIYTPPGGRSSHIGQCSFDSDVVVRALGRQTQQRGRDFTVWFAGGERDGELIWTSHHWADETRYTFPGGPITLRAGEGFRFQCDYANPTAHDLRFGAGETDEQCILMSSFWLAQEDGDARDQRCLLLPRDLADDGIAKKP